MNKVFGCFKDANMSQQAEAFGLTVHPWITRKVLEVLLKLQAARDSGFPGTM